MAVSFGFVAARRVSAPFVACTRRETLPVRVVAAAASAKREDAAREKIQEWVSSSFYVHRTLKQY